MGATTWGGSRELFGRGHRKSKPPCGAPAQASFMPAPRDMADHSRTPRRRGKAKSTQGDESVDDQGFPPVVPEQPPVVKSTYKPRYNEAFMETLMNLEAMYNLKWGDVSYADVFESTLLRQRDHECRMKDDWVECGLAIRSGKKLRLVPSDWSIAGRPAYGMPKLIRYAVLLGMG